MVRAFGALVHSLRWGLATDTVSRGPEARFIPDWRNAPGMETTMLSRAEGLPHPSRETVWSKFRAIIRMLSHICVISAYHSPQCAAPWIASAMPAGRDSGWWVAKISRTLAAARSTTDTRPALSHAAKLSVSNAQGCQASSRR